MQATSMQLSDLGNYFNHFRFILINICCKFHCFNPASGCQILTNFFLLFLLIHNLSPDTDIYDTLLSDIADRCSVKLKLHLCDLLWLCW